MIVVEDNPTRFFTVVGAAHTPEASNTADGVATLPMDDLFNDPEVCRRVGAVIAQGAQCTPDQTVPSSQTADRSASASALESPSDPGSQNPHTPG
jgi:hypothetical protein